MTLEMILSVLSLLLVAIILALLLVRGKNPDDRDLTQLARQTHQVEELVRVTAQMQGQRIVELQQVLDGRLASATAQASAESAERVRADAAARQEMQGLIARQLEEIAGSLNKVQENLALNLDRLRTANSSELERIRQEVGERLQTTLTNSLKEASLQMEALTESTGKRQEELRNTLRSEMERVRTHNESQLEKMRHTVDEKLQGTLERRLGESFELVSQRLEQVQQGLGEMRSLASDVGGLKRVLTNVKSRGTWGEVQLSRQLEDSLAPTQYQANVAIKRGSSERVEFAVKLPGRDTDTPVFLPIDSKFPQEPYERLLEAQELGEVTAIAAATKELEKALRQQAQTIAAKYVHPPASTDFAIMYLPTEGLFAETLKIPGLASDLQSRERVMITGPTTLMSLLGSLQMGFKTLAIEKRSSEVWQVLGAAKEEFNKYGRVWEKLEKQLKTAQNTVEEAGRRTRAVERKLRDVEVFDGEPAAITGRDLLQLEDS